MIWIASSQTHIYQDIAFLSVPVPLDGRKQKEDLKLATPEISQASFLRGSRLDDVTFSMKILSLDSPCPVCLGSVWTSQTPTGEVEEQIHCLTLLSLFSGLAFALYTTLPAWNLTKANNGAPQWRPAAGLKDPTTPLGLCGVAKHWGSAHPWQEPSCFLPMFLRGIGPSSLGPLSPAAHF